MKVGTGWKAGSLIALQLGVEGYGCTVCVSSRALRASLALQR
jgi:hypothetical protein